MRPRNFPPREIMRAFECYVDRDGNITVADGHVCQIKSGVILAVGAGSDFNPDPRRNGNPSWRSFPDSWSGTFIGGSGRNVVVSGVSPLISGPMVPAGIYRPGRPGAFRCGPFLLTVSGAGAATISDGSGTVAILSSGSSAPVGNYASTSYGGEVYNGGSGFVLTAADEVSSPPEMPVCRDAGPGWFSPIPAGNFLTSDMVGFTLDADPSWTISVNTDGSADIAKSGVIIASRPAGFSDCDPGGKYGATAAGMLLNLTDASPVAGDGYDIIIGCGRLAPAAGFVYCRITEVAGVLSVAEGPFFASVLPVNSSGVYHPVIAESDGIAFAQMHTGLLVWPEAGGGGESVGKTWIRISRTEFAALTTEERDDPDKIYNVYRD